MSVRVHQIRLPDVPWLTAALVLLALALRYLLDGNVTVNELTKFIDARIALDPGWLAGTVPAGLEAGDRQWLFRWLIRPLLENGGFYLTSVVGRLAGYALLALALALLFRRLRIHVLFGTAAVLVWARYPSLVAGEWVLPGFEPKLLSYGLAWLALAGTLAPQPRWPAVATALGLAVSLHVLVGLHATLATLVTAWLTRRDRPVSGRAGGVALMVGLLLSLPAAGPVWQHLTGAGALVGTPEPGTPPASAIYVFLRAPHHLDPASWPAGWWIPLAGSLVVLGAGYRVVSSREVRGLIVYAGATLLPFAAGLGLARVDHDGRWLQYYWFRYADVTVPLAVALLVAHGASAGWARIRAGRRAGLEVAAWVLAAGWLVLQAAGQAERWALLSAVAQRGPGGSSRWAETCLWIREHTPPEAVFLVPPHGAESFPWLARRPMVGTFKQVVLSGGLPRWYRKMTDIGGWPEPWPVRGYEAQRRLGEAYARLTPERARTLMETYQADYFVTGTGLAYDLSPVYRNPDFAVYRKP